MCAVCVSTRVYLCLEDSGPQGLVRVACNSLNRLSQALMKFMPAASLRSDEIELEL